VERKQQLLRKYFRKQCSHEELEELFENLKNDPEEEYQDVVRELWYTLHPTVNISPAQSEAMYAQLQEKMDEHTSVFRLSPATWRVAATLTGLLLAASFFLFYFTGEMSTHTSGYGKITTIALPDASTVVLNGNSTIRYRNNWEEGAMREVWLEGEAYFTVRHLENDAKFKVHTNNLSVEVLGTEFNVTNRRGNTRVTLNSGSIRLDTPSDTEEVAGIIMKPGEQALLTEDREFEMKIVNPELFTSWKDSELIFENAPLQQVAQIIEDSYGVPVYFEDSSMQTLKITGTLPSDELDVLTGMLGEILGLQITQSKEGIYINKK